jgi:hypothetical protein
VPAVTVRVAGEVEIVKSGGGGAFTPRLTVAVGLRVSLVPVTVIV